MLPSCGFRLLLWSRNYEIDIKLNHKWARVFDNIRNCFPCCCHRIVIDFKNLGYIPYFVFLTVSQFSVVFLSLRCCV